MCRRKWRGFTCSAQSELELVPWGVLFLEKVGTIGLVCSGSPKRGLPATKQTISNWIVQAITEAYKVRGLPSPFTLWAQSTRGMASSRALLSGVPLQEICEAAGWATPHTFIKFYSLHLPSTPGAQVLSPCWVPRQFYSRTGLFGAWPSGHSFPKVSILDAV